MCPCRGPTAEEAEPLDGIDIGRVVDQGEIGRSIGGASIWYSFNPLSEIPRSTAPSRSGRSGWFRPVSMQGSHRAGGHHHFHAVLSHRCPIACISMGYGPAR